MTNKEVAQKIVDRIVDMIDKNGALPWVKPWNRKPTTITIKDGVKTVTVYPGAWNRQGVPYKGANTYLPEGEYITFTQCKAEGGSVKKGAHGFPVIYWNFYKKEETDPDTGEKKETEIPLLKYYTVFRVDDCEGIEQKHHPEPQTITVQTIREIPVEIDLNPAAEAIVADYASRAGGVFEIRRREISQRAFYSPSEDYVQVPARAQYDAEAEYYSTLFHELAHSTGHKSRLNRFSGSGAAAAFGSQEYSREELVAEITAAGILNALGMETDGSFRNSAAYVKSWVSHIKADPLMYVTAASRAQAAFDMITGAAEGAEEGGEEA